MKRRATLSAKQLLPLIEIILAVTFFAGASIILAQVFAKAHTNSRYAHDINNAVLFISECAEKLKTSEYDGMLNTLHAIGFEKDDNAYYAYLDEKFSVTSKGLAYLTVAFESSEKGAGAGRLITGQFICLRKDGIELARIDTAVFFAGAGDAAH